MIRSKKIILLLIIIFLIIGFIFFGMESKKESSKKVILNEDLIARQKKIDEDINSYIKTEKYSISAPKIIVNPYEISPLTALIIFKDKDKQNIKVYVNDKLLLITDNSEEKSIPIIGLIANKENIITLDNGKKTYEYKILTKVTDCIDALDVKVKSINNYSYFVSSSTTPLAFSSFNGEGKMNFHLNIASQGEIEFIDDKSFIVPAEEYITKDGISIYTSLYVVDYLGKIIKRIDTSYGYHHDVDLLEDGTLLVLGSKKDNKMSIVYRLDIETGKILDYIDFYDVFKSVDSSWDNIDEKLKWGYGINSIDYNELTDELLVSLRCLNLVMSINYKTKEINWMYTNEEEFKNFSEYLLKPTDNKTYPLGQHEAKFINSNIISLYNNNFDEKNMKNTNVPKTQIPATALMLNIDKNTKTISIIKSFKEENKNSYALGGFKMYKLSNIVNYAYFFKDEAINKEISLFDYKDNTYSRIVEYDNYSNIIFDATIEDRLYRVSINELKPYYQKYTPKEYIYLSNLENNVKIDESKLDSAVYYNNILKIYHNYYDVTLDNKMIDELVLILKGKDNYAIPYIGTSTYYEIKKGTYDIYIKLNNEYYNLNQKITY